MDDKRIPVILLTGFLGSGKTTLLSRLLRDSAMAGCAVLINEVGAVGLDHLLVEEVSEDISLLESGCLCCAVRGDLSRSLRDLFMRRLRRKIGALDRVVIETTGLADPAPVIHTLLRDFFLVDRFRLEGVITTVDVRNVPWQLGQHAEAVKQVAMADRIVLTKCDLADSLQIAEAEERVSLLNPGAQQIQSDPAYTPSGLLDGLGLYDAASKTPDAQRWLGDAAILAQQRLQARQGVFSRPEPSLHDEAVQSHVLYFSVPFRAADFSRTMDMLLSVVGAQILRIKGLLAIEGEAAPRVIHAVQHERYPDSSLPAWPDADHRSRLVFIVNNLPLSVIEKIFSAFCERSPD